MMGGAPGGGGGGAGKLPIMLVSEALTERTRCNISWSPFDNAAADVSASSASKRPAAAQ
jgi:hypothetical protein